MSYDFRDFIFDLSKEALKQERESTIRQQCNAMRNKAAMLSGEEREQAFAAITEYEQKHMQAIESYATNTAAVKEVLKMLGY